MTRSDPVREVLEHGEIEVQGRMPWSSNATYLVRVVAGDQWLRAVYKPRRGERPLWDFPPGLDRREAAAFELSEALGWDLVPHTVVRDGPLGPGSVQRFVDADFGEHYFTLHQAGLHHGAWRRLCVFDLVANNTDRKSGHCLVSVGGEPFAIDHGVCFHEDFKLRTVIWEFAGEPIPESILDDLRLLCRSGLPEALSRHLADREVAALRERIDRVLSLGHFPVDESGRRYPWPLV